MPSQTLIDEMTINQVYNRYIEMLQEDPNSTIDMVFREEPLASRLPQSNSNERILIERQIEQAVIDKFYQEEETHDIQQMIAKFYNKFDELHEQSVQQTLSKKPNIGQLKNEVKYRIPERWTKRFHKFDIVDINIFHQKPGIVQERGRINKDSKVNEIELNKQMAQMHLKQQQEKHLNEKQVMQPLNNQFLKTSISRQKLEQAITNDQESQGDKAKKPLKSPATLIPDDAESTDVSKAGDFTGKKP